MSEGIFQPPFDLGVGLAGAVLSEGGRGVTAVEVGETEGTTPF